MELQLQDSLHVDSKKVPGLNRGCSMASEAEIERLYQLFVAKGGGAGTFDNANLTPKQYSDASSSSQLSALQLAQLESKQHQYNKQSALRTIADEIDANNFTNPYATRGAYSSGLFGTSALARVLASWPVLHSSCSSAPKAISSSAWCFTR